MSNLKNFAKLRNTLADFYPNVSDAQLIVDDAGLRRGHINFNTIPRNIWHGILLEASRADQLENLIEIAGEGYPTIGAAYEEFLASGGEIPSIDNESSPVQHQRITLFSLTIWKLTVAITIGSLLFVLVFRWPQTVQTLKKIYENLKTIIKASETLTPTPTLSFTLTPDLLTPTSAVIITPTAASLITLTSQPAAPVSAPAPAPTFKSVPPTLTSESVTLTSTLPLTLPLIEDWNCYTCELGLKSTAYQMWSSSCNLCNKRYIFTPESLRTTFVPFFTPSQIVTPSLTSVLKPSAATPIPSLTPTPGTVTAMSASQPVTVTSKLSLTLTSETVTATPTPSLTPTPEPTTVTPTPEPVTATSTPFPSVSPTLEPSTVTSTSSPTSTPEPSMVTSMSEPSTATSTPTPSLTPIPEPATPTAVLPTSAPTSELVAATPATLPTPTSQSVEATPATLPTPTYEPATSTPVPVKTD